MPAEILEFKAKPKVEVSHGFSFQNAIEVCNTKSPEVAKATIAGDLKFQTGEIIAIPISDDFTYIHKTEPKKLIFECDSDTQTDILDVTSKQTRNGKEYRAVQGWRNIILAENEALKKGKGVKAKTIIQINPMQDKNDPTDKCDYILAQANIAYIDGSDRIRVFQAQFGGDTDSCARLFKVLSQNADFDPKDIKSVDQMMMSFGVIDGRLTYDQVLNAMTFVTGKKLPSHRELVRQKEEIAYKARLNALKFYNAVKLGLSTEELKKLYAKLLGDTLPGSFLEEMRSSVGWSGGLMAMETSCGLVTFGAESMPGMGGVLSMLTLKQEKWGYTVGDCEREGCDKKNVKVGPCSICIYCEEKLDRQEKMNMMFKIAA